MNKQDANKVMRHWPSWPESYMLNVLAVDNILRKSKAANRPRMTDDPEQWGIEQFRTAHNATIKQIESVEGYIGKLEFAYGGASGSNLKPVAKEQLKRYHHMALVIRERCLQVTGKALR